MIKLLLDAVLSTHDAAGLALAKALRQWGQAASPATHEPPGRRAGPDLWQVKVRAARPGMLARWSR
ncbi:MAG: hypothetical protein JWO63_2114 [Frankiales bacterium]|nr:hypothetical protein [Frankiales bacterium]